MDEDTLAAIYDTFSPGLFRYACRLLGDSATAEDCVAEVAGAVVEEGVLSKVDEEL